MNPERLNHLLGLFSAKRLLVVGDVMLDEFIWGNVRRISPEAPVPVIDFTKESCFPGGAANVALNLREFTGHVTMMGVVGDDGGGQRLRELLEGKQIDTAPIQVSPLHHTTVKTRIIARNQQVVRVDRERRQTLSEAQFAHAVATVEAMLDSIDAVIIEDYGKGFISQELADAIASSARKAGKIVTVDPNPNNPLAWKNVTVVKPNRSEAFATAGMPWSEPVDPVEQDTAMYEVAGRLMKQWNTELVLITLGEQGMLLFQQGQTPYHTPPRARKVFDLSGAGDTSIALFTLALAAGATPVEAAEVANHAGGVVVGKLGTATLTPAELLASFDDHRADS